MIRLSTVRPSLLRLGAYPKWRTTCPGRAVKTVRLITDAAKLGTRSGVTSHWTAETLRTTEKYPLSLKLLEKANPNSEEARERVSRPVYKVKRKTATVRHARTQIVSPDLCGTSSLGRVLLHAC
jgi:hypothetical protein